MLVASKFEEIYAPEVNDFVFITDNAYTPQNILDMEVGCFITDNAYTPQNTRHKGTLFFLLSQTTHTDPQTYSTTGKLWNSCDNVLACHRCAK